MNTKAIKTADHTRANDKHSFKSNKKLRTPFLLLTDSQICGRALH